jgi:glycine hydroxymethyltransferase
VDEILPAGSIEQIDPLLSDLIRFEAERQHRKLILIASESICPPAVRQALACEFGHIYAEGYPSPRTLAEPTAQLESFAYQLASYRRLSNRRYYKGCEYVDFLEQLVRRRTAEVFANALEPADNIFVNAQPLSGAAANNAVYNAFVRPGETVLGPSLTHGGHLTHGSQVNRSGMNFHVVSYEISRGGELDYDAMEKLAVEHKPKLIIGGFSAYPWDIQWARMRGIADSVGAVLLADIAHLAGPVAAGLLNSPVGHAQVVSFTTHKTLCGPRGAMLLSTDPDIAAKLDMGVFPGEQTQGHRQIAGRHHADGHCRAMGDLKVGSRFHSMTNGMAEIKDAAEIRLFFICLDHACFDGAANSDNLREDVEIEPENSFSFGFEKREEISIGDDAVFDHLCQAV